MSEYRYQKETHEANSLVNKNPCSSASIEHAKGMKGNEPIIVIADSLIRYAKAHEYRYGSKVAEDYYALRYFKLMIEGLRGMLNTQGALSLEKDLRDSKDNGTVSVMLQSLCDIAGIDFDEV